MRAIILFFAAAVSPVVLWGQAGEDAASQSVRILKSTRAGRPFRWQSTAGAKDFAWSSGAKIARGKAAGVVAGSLGIVASVPLTAIAAPFDLIAAPFRRTTTVKFALRGRVVDESGEPARDAVISGEAVGSYSAVKGARGRELFRRTYISRTDSEGYLAIEAEGSFGPNKHFIFLLGLVNPPENIDTISFVNQSGKIQIFSDRTHRRWRIIPGEPLAKKTF